MFEELSASCSNLPAFFPPNLSDVLKRVADAKSIPYAGMAAAMLFLTCVFSQASWCIGVGGQIEPLILYLKNMGMSGIKDGDNYVCQPRF